MLNTQQRSLDSLTQFGNLECGQCVVKKAEILFARIDAEEFQKQLEADRKQEEQPAEERSLLSRRSRTMTSASSS